MGKALDEWNRRRARTVFLVPARTGMSWFLRAREAEGLRHATVVFWPGRIAFEGSNASPYEYSTVIGIGAGLEALRSLERSEGPDLFAEVAP